MNTNQEIILQFGADDVLESSILEYIVGELLSDSDFDNIIPKALEKKTRSKNFYQVTVPAYRDDEFKEHFRMSRNSFEALLKVVGHQVDGMEQPIACVSLEKKLLFTIWVLSKQESFLAVSDRFDIAKTSGYEIFMYCKYFIRIDASIHKKKGLMPQYIKWPNIRKQLGICQDFEERSNGIPGVIGAIDGCHIPIKQPVGNPHDFYNRKQFHSIILQGVCDSNARFIDVFIGMPGRMHDACVFKKRPLFKKLAEPRQILSPEKHLIGDSAYPLLGSLLTPFRDNGNLTPEQILYNTRLSMIRSIIERAFFGRLKGKFRRLKFLDIANAETGNKIISAACMLHNFILTNGEVDDFDSSLLEEDIHPEEIETRNSEELVIQTAVSKRNSVVQLLYR